MVKHEDALTRLINIEGHVRGIQRMIEKDKYCIDIIRQIHALSLPSREMNPKIGNVC